MGKGNGKHAVVVKRVPIEARTIISRGPVPTSTTSRGKVSTDDITVDYLSILDLEDRKKRFSARVEDADLRETVHLQKLYRQVQRQVHCRQEVGSAQAWGQEGQRGEGGREGGRGKQLLRIETSSSVSHRITTRTTTSTSHGIELSSD